MWSVEKRVKDPILGERWSVDEETYSLEQDAERAAKAFAAANGVKFGDQVRVVKRGFDPMPPPLGKPS